MDLGSVGRFLAERANPIAILLGLGCLTAAAFTLGMTVGIAALGLALCIAGLDVRGRR